MKPSLFSILILLALFALGGTGWLKALDPALVYTGSAMSHALAGATATPGTRLALLRPSSGQLLTIQLMKNLMFNSQDSRLHRCFWTCCSCLAFFLVCDLPLVDRIGFRLCWNMIDELFWVELFWCWQIDHRKENRGYLYLTGLSHGNVLIQLCRWSYLWGWWNFGDKLEWHRVSCSSYFKVWYYCFICSFLALSVYPALAAVYLLPRFYTNFFFMLTHALVIFGCFFSVSV